ncbi:hypothetical protein [Breznakiella homolactica]|uniref:Uncharacterized protein n=1 Tax=Breznakiella homolactica TaxID=2798577 RepID=A0A7T7XN04_9SPIR|nr:hypothetical protein [Breznakiella homolactica]QQO09232.1 hypothetical protein JFL75_20255 [Breznakiella homolactica]
MILFTGCELFNMSAPDYIAEYAGGAAAEKWEFVTDTYTSVRSGYTTFPPSSICDPDLVQIRVRLRNPQKYELVPYAVVTNEGTSNVIAEAVVENYERVLIILQNAKVRDNFRLKLEISHVDGLRKFEDYEIQDLFVCNSPPEIPTNLKIAGLDGSGRPVAGWEMLADGDHDDNEEVQIQFKEGDGTPVSRRYTRVRTEVPEVWRSSDGYELTRSGDSYTASFPMVKAAGTELDTHYHFHVTVTDEEGYTAVTATPGFGSDQSPTVGFSYDPNTVDGWVTMTLTASGGGSSGTTIYYSVDGGQEKTYTGPFAARDGSVIRARSKTPGLQDSYLSVATVRVTYLSSVYVDPTLAVPPTDPDAGWTETNPVATVHAAVEKIIDRNFASGTIVLLKGMGSGNHSGSSGMADVVIPQAAALKTLTIKRENSAVIDAGSAGKRGLYVNAPGATVTLQGMEIKNASIPSGNGGGILVDAGTVVLDGGTAVYGSSAANGAGVYITGSGAVRMENGAVYLNTATANGGGVYIEDGGSLAINSGKIGFNTLSASQPNSAGAKGGAVYAEAPSVPGHTALSMSGAAAVNTSGGVSHGVYLKTGAGITLTGSLTASSAAVIEPEVYALNSRDSAKVLGGSAALITANKSKFTLSDAAYQINNNGYLEPVAGYASKVEINGVEGSVSYEKFTDSINGVGSGQTAIITILKDFETGNSYASGSKTITIVVPKGQTRKITYTPSGTAAWIQAASATVNVGHPNSSQYGTLELIQTATDNNGHGILYAAGNGVINLYDNVIVKSASVVGLYMWGGTINMYGGKITECGTKWTSGRAGAAVYVGLGTFNMYGGEITNNKGAAGGGSVYVSRGQVFNMYGGVIKGDQNGTGLCIMYGGYSASDPTEVTINGSAVIAPDNVVYIDSSVNTYGTYIRIGEDGLQPVNNPYGTYTTTAVITATNLSSGTKLLDGTTALIQNNRSKFTVKGTSSTSSGSTVIDDNGELNQTIP